MNSWLPEKFTIINYYICSKSMYCLCIIIMDENNSHSREHLTIFANFTVSKQIYFARRYDPPVATLCPFQGNQKLNCHPLNFCAGQKEIKETTTSYTRVGGSIIFVIISCILLGCPQWWPICEFQRNDLINILLSKYRYSTKWKLTQ